MRMDDNFKRINDLDIEAKKIRVLVDSKSEAYGKQIKLMTLWILGNVENNHVGLLTEIRKYNKLYDFAPFDDVLPRFSENVMQIMVAYDSVVRLYEGVNVGGKQQNGVIDVMMKSFEGVKDIALKTNEDNIKLKKKLVSYEEESEKYDRQLKLLEKQKDDIVQEEKEKFVFLYWKGKIENFIKEKGKGYDFFAELNKDGVTRSNLMHMIGKKALKEDYINLI